MTFLGIGIIFAPFKVMKRKNKKPKKLKLYEVSIPIKESWVFNVLAPNKKEAKDIAKVGVSPYEDCVEQSCVDRYGPVSCREIKE